MVVPKFTVQTGLDVPHQLVGWEKAATKCFWWMWAVHSSVTLKGSVWPCVACIVFVPVNDAASTTDINGDATTERAGYSD